MDSDGDALSGMIWTQKSSIKQLPNELNNTKVTQNVHKDHDESYSIPYEDQWKFTIFDVNHDHVVTAANMANEILDHIRNYCKNYFESTSRSSQKSELTRDLSAYLVQIVPEFCTRANYEVFDHEPRLVKVESPSVVFGDIHGNIKDLYEYEKLFWGSRDAAVREENRDRNFLFLGDFVDRGLHSVECAVFLIALKVFDPNRFILVRGNHEVRSVNRNYSFYRECVNKFQHNGHRVWDAISSVFDRLPIAALIDEAVFCVHGGIPKSATTLAQIATIPKPLVDVERESPAAHEIMWSDPIDSMTTFTTQRDEQLTRDNISFVFNRARRTAFYYTELAIENFFHTNNVIIMIRAHEMIPKGYKTHFHRKVITVFSSSQYGGANNVTACILVNPNEIIPMTFDGSQTVIRSRI